MIKDSTLIDAEQAVLSAMMMEQRATHRARRLITADLFQVQAHRAIYNAMCAIDDADAAIDPLTLAAKMEQFGTLQKAGGKDYIGFLIDAAPTAANIEYHARLMLTARDRKKLEGFLRQALAQLERGEGNIRRSPWRPKNFSSRSPSKKMAGGSGGSPSRTSKTCSTN
jgi:replicative DNA helicase